MKHARMLTVGLYDMKFHAFHGVYPEERETGTYFIVDMEAGFEESGQIRKLSQTINYQVMHAVVSEKMKKPVALIEELAQGCVEEVYHRFPFIKTIEIRIRKMHPPLPGEVGCSQVTLKKNFA